MKETWAAIQDNIWSLAVFFVIFESVYLGMLAVNHDAVSDNFAEDVEITAHRGGTVKTPENTISALNYTIDCGADYAEIDVQETKDKELILLHDNTFERTAGVKKKFGK